MKRLIILCDGMADYPLKSLGGKTPLMAARTPVMNRLAREGAVGLFNTIPPGLPAGSEVANLSVMGYDPRENFCQRGVLEAASLGVELSGAQLALRCNLIWARDNKIGSHSGGDLSHEEGAVIIKLLNDKLGGGGIRFYQGIHYRHLLVIDGGDSHIQCWPPHDYIGGNIAELKVGAFEKRGEKTAETINKLVSDSALVLEALPLNKKKAALGERRPNLIWPWAAGEKPRMKTIKELTGLSGAVITAVDLIKGLGIYAGMKVIEVEGATGNSRTNYEGKARAALKALQKYDYVYLHVEAADEASHDGDLDLKIKVIEDLDSRLVAPIIRGIAEAKTDIRIALLPDHPTPVESGIHVSDPVPVILWGNGMQADAVQEYNEEEAKKGSLGLMDQKAFFDSFFVATQVHSCKKSTLGDPKKEFKMSSKLLKKLEISEKKLQEINNFLTAPSNELTRDLIKVIAKYGSVEEINAKAEEAQNLDNQLAGLRKINSPYLKDLEWLMKAKDKKMFISMEEYRQGELGANYKTTRFNADFAVTLEISALQYFPWLITEAKMAIEKKELMPGRYIRVRFMKEQEDQKDGELTAIAAAMNIIGATYVETLDSKGTDGANVHLGGPDTITGYFGGVGQPNDYALKWTDEFLHYYTNYGVKQVLNLNPGTILLGYMLHKLGINNEFKISVFMGNDNPYSILWTLLTAKLFSRDDGSTPLIGFNFSNSVNNRTIELSARVRSGLSLEACVRFEHHITETWKSIVRQPYDRTNELVELGKKVKNIGAKHEGGPVKVEEKREHPSDILDYFIPKTEVISKGLMPKLEQNYLDKHEAINLTANVLTRNGIPVTAAPALHER